MNLLGIGAGTVAALFVQADGCYAGLPGVDAWSEHRDARLYAGPYPVVAHPPCQRWGAMADVNYARWGGDHNRPGNDGGCFAAALESVRRFGGVLEHPAKTKAWAAHGLTRPAAIGWQRTIDDGWVCEVWQSAYGHRANKATWLYYHGTNPPFELRWARPKGTHQIGFYDQRGKTANKPTLGKREANATPLEFRDELIRLAMMAHNPATTTENEMRKLHVGTSPLTNGIYAGHVLKDGATWGEGKQDVTGAACGAVCEHVLANGEPVMVTCNGKPKYEITVREL